MPLSIAGIGTTVCSAAGDVYWGADADCDAVECFIVFHIPVAPIRAVHIYDQSVELGTATLLTGLFRDTYQSVPIQFRWSLFFRAVCRRLWPVIWVIALILVLVGFLGEHVSDALRIGLAAAGWVLLAAAGVATWWFWRTDLRNRNIRYVLGRHEFGTSDPVSWLPPMLKKMPGARELFETKSYGGAVAGLIAAGEFSQAMWAARLCAALENRDRGEQLTDEVLDNADVRAAVLEVKKQAGGTSFRLTPAVSIETVKLWQQLMTAEKPAASSTTDKKSPAAGKTRKRRSDTD